MINKSNIIAVQTYDIILLKYDRINPVNSFYNSDALQVFSSFCLSLPLVTNHDLVVD